LLEWKTGETVLLSRKNADRAKCRHKRIGRDAEYGEQTAGGLKADLSITFGRWIPVRERGGGSQLARLRQRRMDSSPADPRIRRPAGYVGKSEPAADAIEAIKDYKAVGI